ncbi:MAG TPA: hypothetical protein VFF11_10960 [Candidatus Binatia bacterium]|nr:hypothetical protein [Candidatus Binatia bacterium]
MDSGDTAFGLDAAIKASVPLPSESGVALRFPPQSKSWSGQSSHYSVFSFFFFPFAFKPSGKPTRLTGTKSPRAAAPAATANTP